MKPLIHLEGKVAIITGGSRGIGEAIARSFAAHGAKVVVASRKAEGVQRVADAINKDGGEALGVAFHAGESGAPARLVDEAVAKFGKVDILVNNAATNPYFGPLLKAERAAWDKTFDVNLRGYYEGACAVANHLIARDAPGSIINISSVQGLVGAWNEGIYGMTKAAIFSLTRTLAVELGPKRIRVNCVAPALVETKFSAAAVANPDIHDKVLARTPLGRIGQPEDVVGPVLLLASDASSWMTGTTILVDGGLTVMK